MSPCPATCPELLMPKDIRDKALAAENYSAAVAAEVSRGKVAGFYTDKIKLVDERERMTDEELREQVAEAYRKYGPVQGLTH